MSPRFVVPVEPGFEPETPRRGGVKTNLRAAGLLPEGKDEVGGKKAPTHGIRHRPRILTDREMRHRALAWLLPLLTFSLPRRKVSPKLLRRISDLLLRVAARHSPIARARAD